MKLFQKFLLLVVFATANSAENSFFRVLMRDLDRMDSKTNEVAVLADNIYPELENDVEEIYKIVVRDVAAENIIILPNHTRKEVNNGLRKADMVFIVTDAFKVVSNDQVCGDRVEV
jgi:predicted  nucleic acid-binding Zn ribbon protein